MGNLSLITGINGHLLGNVMLTKQNERGEKVRALVAEDGEHYCDTVKDCEVFHADFNYSTGLDEAMEGVDVLYHNTAVMKYHDPDLENGLIKPCIDRTINIIKTAQKHKVKKIVLISCYITTGYVRHGIYDARTWNEEPLTYYEKARTEAERAAWRLAKEHDLWMVSLLPARMIGPYVFSGHLTASVNMLNMILLGKDFIHPVNLKFNMNYVDVRQVADCILKAPSQGENGARYLLANQESISWVELYNIARSFNPKVRKPLSLGKPALMAIASATEGVGRITNTAPLLERKMFNSLYDFDPKADVEAAKKAFGFNPAPPEPLVREVYDFLYQRKQKK